MYNYVHSGDSLGVIIRGQEQRVQPLEMTVVYLNIKRNKEKIKCTFYAQATQASGSPTTFLSNSRAREPVFMEAVGSPLTNHTWLPIKEEG